MRMIRMAVILFFLISCICFGTYKALEWSQKDHNAPKIYMDKDEIVVSVSAKKEKLLAGVTAEDAEDGDLTDRIQVASLSPLVGDDERTIRYIVFDDAGQLATASRTVVYKDYVSPKIYLYEPLRFSVEDFGNQVSKLQVAAEDVLDGDLSSKMRISYSVQYLVMETGEHDITLQVNNSAGDTRILPLKMTIVDPEEEKGKVYPELSDYIVYTKEGKELDLKGYLCEPEEKGGIPVEEVSILSKVDYTQQGIYTVEYSYTTPDDITAVTTLYVVVEE